MASKLTITINDDGTIRTDATGLDGTEAEIMAQLQELAKEVGGELEVEKHVHTHGHTHSHSNHTHAKGGK